MLKQSASSLCAQNKNKIVFSDCCEADGKVNLNFELHKSGPGPIANDIITCSIENIGGKKISHNQIKALEGRKRGFIFRLPNPC